MNLTHFSKPEADAKFNVEINEQHFNLLWRSIHACEQSLLRIIEAHQDDEDSEESALLETILSI